MITRTIKYTASDGTEHDSPQEAAEQDLEMALWPLIERGASKIENMRVTDGYDLYAVTREVVEELARNPEALRDALNTYFEDLEAHPDVEIDHHQRAKEIVDGWPDWKRGYRITEHSPEIEGKITVHGANYNLSYAGGEQVRWMGNPDDPTTWRADLPVDHPSYCRPFGTKEN